METRGEKPDENSTEDGTTASHGDPVVDVNERTWLPRYCRGDKDCFSQLVHAYKKPIYSYLLRSGFDKPVCEDLFQEIFMKIHQAAHVYRASQPLKPWIFTIALNTVRNYLRRQLGQSSTGQEMDALQHPDPKPESVINIRQTLSKLEMMISALPKAQSDVLILSTIEELSHKQIAEVMRIPINTVKTHLRRARQTLLQNYLDINE